MSDKNWYKYNIDGFEFYSFMRNKEGLNKNVKLLTGEEKDVESCNAEELKKLANIVFYTGENTIIETPHQDNYKLRFGNITGLARKIYLDKNNDFVVELKTGFRRSTIVDENYK